MIALSKPSDFLRNVLCILFPIGVLLYSALSFDMDPAEDAHIIFRYAENLAAGHGMVWNIGGDPVEGATSFLWAVLLAAGLKLGISATLFARVLGLVFTAATIAMMFLAYTQLSAKIVRTVAVGLLVCYALSPAHVHAMTGFSTSLFTLLIVSIYCLSAHIIANESSSKWAHCGLPLCYLFIGLTRPEGVIYAALSFVSLFTVLSPQQRSRLTRHVVLFFVLPGIVYFLLRWCYFGYLLPNTFYVKSGGALIHLSGVQQIWHLFRVSAPMLIFSCIVLTYINDKKRLWYIALALPAIVFPFAYLLIEQWQNVAHRFQYPVFPIYLILFGHLLCGVLLTHLASPREPVRLSALFASIVVLAISALCLFIVFGKIQAATCLAAICAFTPVWIRHVSANLRSVTTIGLCAVLSIFIGSVLFRDGQRFNGVWKYDDRKVVGEALSDFAEQGLVLMTTEAGMLPYYSRWHVVDALGLNNEVVAHQGLTHEYIASIKPDIIMFPSSNSPEIESWNTGFIDQLRMKTLYEYAQESGYELVAIVNMSDVGWGHRYYVRRDSRFLDEITQSIRGHAGLHYAFSGDT